MALDVDPVNAAIAGTVIDETTLEPITIGDTVEIVEIWGISTEATEVLTERYGRCVVDAESNGKYYLLDIPTSTDMILGLLGESVEETVTVYTVAGTTREVSLSSTREVNLSSADKTYIYDILNP